MGVSMWYGRGRGIQCIRGKTMNARQSPGRSDDVDGKGMPNFASKQWPRSTFAVPHIEASRRSMPGGGGGGCHEHTPQKHTHILAPLAPTFRVLRAGGRLPPECPGAALHTMQSACGLAQGVGGQPCG